eukprot:6182235-Pleurochrysis_carterae.AAC.5
MEAHLAFNLWASRPFAPSYSWPLTTCVARARPPLRRSMLMKCRHALSEYARILLRSNDLSRCWFDRRCASRSQTKVLAAGGPAALCFAHRHALAQEGGRRPL